jgi:hypothetical protein
MNKMTRINLIRAIITLLLLGGLLLLAQQAGVGFG